MTAKINEAAIAALTMLKDHADACNRNPDMVGAYWHTLAPSYVSDVWAGFQPATLKALVRKGLAEFHPQYERSYWTRITEDGRLALEQHRERTGFYS